MDERIFFFYVIHHVFSRILVPMTFTVWCFTLEYSMLHGKGTLQVSLSYISADLHMGNYPELVRPSVVTWALESRAFSHLREGDLWAIQSMRRIWDTVAGLEMEGSMWKVWEGIELNQRPVGLEKNPKPQMWTACSSANALISALWDSEQRIQWC